MLASTPTPSRPMPAFGSVRAGPSPLPEPRRFVDSFSRAWTVREVQSPEPRVAARPTCLVFETESLARRVRQFPANWHELSESQLEELSKER